MLNLATVLVGSIVFGIFAAIIVRGIRNRKAGKGGCTCGCGSCPGKDICHPEK